MVSQAALCLVGGPKPDSMQPWAHQGWGLWQTSEHWASLMVFLPLYCFCRKINSNTQKLKQMEWLAVLSSFSHVSFQYLSCKSKVWLFVGVFFLLWVVWQCLTMRNKQTNSWLILGGRGMTAAWFHQQELRSRIHQSLVLSAWDRRDHAAPLGTQKSCNPSSEYQMLGCWKGLIIGPELTKFNGSVSFTSAVSGSWSSLYQHF